MNNRKTLNIEIGRRLQLSRENMGLTQEILAEQINRSTQFVSMLERGMTGPSLETIINVAGILGVSTEWLLRGRQATADSAAIAEKIALLTEPQQAVVAKIIDNLLELAAISECQPKSDGLA